MERFKGVKVGGGGGEGEGIEEGGQLNVAVLNRGVMAGSHLWSRDISHPITRLPPLTVF